MPSRGEYALASALSNPSFQPDAILASPLKPLRETRPMPRIPFALAALFFLLPLPARAQDSTLADLLSDAREEAGLVGMGAAVMVEGEIVALAVDGERIKGKGDMLSRDDAWHLGSITKSMTGTLIATMVEDGTLSLRRRSVISMAMPQTKAGAVSR